MAGLCEGDNEPPGSLKTICNFVELADTHLVYGAANGNSRAAERLMVSMMAQPLIYLFKFESIYLTHSVNIGLAGLDPLHGLLVLLTLPHSILFV
ncbi:hypothetical protein ANN_24935 [Periplaneta americana]|uniref:Uncharacterized protein n=1 Tax=Periplaneta americana TaxID=6978 RepID=A0ABQ8S0B0_PERAM|nr:hypothetical protein ANN_24935 [Periplaneta americana]